MTVSPSVLIPIAPGTNRDHDLAMAFEAAGAEVAQHPLQAIRSGDVKLADHQLLALPGGFSYGDALGAGRLLGLDLGGWFADQVRDARARQMPIIGICNGFQALVKAGILPGGPPESESLSGSRFDSEGWRPKRRSPYDASLTANSNGQFECRWIHMTPERSDSVWIGSLSQPLRCPVAHGEGRFRAADLSTLNQTKRVAFRYSRPDGTPAGGSYPLNPNDSDGDVAGLIDHSGLVLGLMPHPENHVFSRQDPQRRRAVGGNCLPLFLAGVEAVS